MKTIHHDHVVIFADVAALPGEEHGDLMKEFLADLVTNQGMEIIQGPEVAWVGEKQLVGWSAECLIKTSHCVIHVWNESSRIELDFYTCGKLDLKQVAADLHPFAPSRIRYWHYKRDDGMVLVEEGVISP